MISRTAQKDLLYLAKHFPAVCILGPRQCGKTTLAKAVMHKLKKQVVYLDFEKPRDLARLSDPEAFLEQHTDKCVVMDEVQVKPEIFSVLRPLIDEKRKPGRFILLGSASPELVKGVSESLAGRISYLELTPFTFPELGKGAKIDKHWFRGGFPQSYLARNNAVATKWLDDFIRTYIERDLNTLFGASFARGVMHRFWTMLAHYHGGIWNAETFARSLGVTGPTVNRYLDFLEAAFIIHRLPAYFVNTKKRLVKAPKVYIRDSGLLHRLLDMDSLDELRGYPGVGNSWEGYVVEQVRACKTAKQQLYFYRTHDGAECDLLIVRGNKVVACIEIKLSSAPTVSKGFHVCATELKCKTKIVVAPVTEAYAMGDDVTVMPLPTLLAKLALL